MTKSKLKIKKKSFWRVAVFVVICGALLQLFVAHLLSGKGEALAKIEEKSQEVRAENKNFQEELYKHSSLSEIAYKGKELGYIRPQKFVYFNDSSSVAFLGLTSKLKNR